MGVHGLFLPLTSIVDSELEIQLFIPLLGIRSSPKLQENLIT